MGSNYRRHPRQAKRQRRGPTQARCDRRARDPLREPADPSTARFGARRRRRADHLAGLHHVVRGQNETVTSSTPDTVAGYILSRSADLYGRCIALVGRGAPPQDDGSAFFVDVDALRTTANHHLIVQGLAYPTYYRALFPDLRNEFTAVAQQARDGGLGVWARDATTSGFEVAGLASLEDDVVIVPKLFRRLVDYLHLGDDSMAGLPAFLDQAADKFFVLSTGHSTTGLDAVVEVSGNNVKMTRPIEDLVFDEK
jgi:hypothetical protein